MSRENSRRELLVAFDYQNLEMTLGHHTALLNFAYRQQ